MAEVANHALRQRWTSLQRQGKESQFYDTWIHTAAARWQHGKPWEAVLACRHVPPPPTGPVVIASGDGAGPATPKSQHAGWGGVVYVPARHDAERTQVHLHAGPVVVDPAHPQYQGATAPTNNAAELQAITHMASAAHEQTRIGRKAEVHSDSTVAIMAALGTGGHGNRKRKKARKAARKSNGRGAAKTDNAVLACKARAQYMRCRTEAPGRVVIRKVKGHSGDGWNEVADALAAIGRSISEAQTVLTAELMDRVRRALEAEGVDPAEPQIVAHGFRLTADT